jgi:hypothetical protein
MFSSIKRDSIPFLIINNRGDGDVAKAITDMSWSSLVQMMSKHEVRTNKNGMSIIPARFKPRDQWVLSPPREDYTPTYRNKDNVEAITIAIVDVDIEGGLESARKALEGFEYLIYSTHSYTVDTPYKFRAVIRLDEPIPVDKWPLAFSCLVSQIDMDKQCGNADRLYFLPAVSPNAGIPPLFEHHRGRVMTYNDILKMGGDNPEDLLSRKVQERRNRRHFADQENGSNLTVVEQLEWTWESMLDRNSGFVDELKSSDSRHHFALRTIGKEVQRYHERVNLPALVSFLYKASFVYSSKPLNRGNTPREIPEFIESAFRKFCTGENPLKRFEDFNGVTLKRAIELAIRDAEVSQATQKWIVDKKISFLGEVKNVPTPAEMRVLQRENMQALVVDGDGVSYAKKCVDTFLNSSYEFKADCITQFVISSYNAYLTRYKPDAVKHEEMGALVAIDFPEALAGKKGEEVARFIRPSLRKAILEEFQMAMVRDLNSSPSMAR